MLPRHLFHLHHGSSLSNHSSSRPSFGTWIVLPLHFVYDPCVSVLLYSAEAVCVSGPQAQGQCAQVPPFPYFALGARPFGFLGARREMRNLGVQAVQSIRAAEDQAGLFSFFINSGWYTRPPLFEL